MNTTNKHTHTMCIRCWYGVWPKQKRRNN